jgi:hypothetical protein
VFNNTGGISFTKDFVQQKLSSLLGRTIRTLSATLGFGLKAYHVAGDLPLECG